MTMSQRLRIASRFFAATWMPLDDAARASRFVSDLGELLQVAIEEAGSVALGIEPEEIRAYIEAAREGGQHGAG